MTFCVLVPPCIQLVPLLHPQTARVHHWAEARFRRFDKVLNFSLTAAVSALTSPSRPPAVVLWSWLCPRRLHVCVSTLMMWHTVALAGWHHFLLPDSMTTADDLSAGRLWLAETTDEGVEVLQVCSTFTRCFLQRRHRMWCHVGVRCK